MIGRRDSIKFRGIGVMKQPRYFKRTILISFIVAVIAMQTYFKLERLNRPTIKRVIAFDTLELTNGERVRLIGIGMPEGAGYDLDTLVQMKQEAKKFVKSLGVEGKKVRLIYDVQRKDKDGASLVYGSVEIADLVEGIDLFQDDDPYEFHNNSVPLEIFLNAYIIRAGYASPVITPPNVEFADLFQRYYQKAQENNRGRWRK